MKSLLLFFACYLIRVCEATHAAHHPENVVVGSIDADLSGLCTFHGCIGEDKLESSIVNAREVATARWLVFLRSKSEGVDIDPCVRVAGVVLVGLHKVKVGSFAFREAVLAVELELSGDHWILAPAVHAEGCLREDECASVGHSREDAAAFVVACQPGSFRCSWKGRADGHPEESRFPGCKFPEE